MNIGTGICFHVHHLFILSLPPASDQIDKKGGLMKNQIDPLPGSRAWICSRILRLYDSMTVILWFQE